MRSKVTGAVKVRSHELDILKRTAVRWRAALSDIDGQLECHWAEIMAEFIAPSAQPEERARAKV